ncbi:hypothetical protein SCYAM73S_03412 [Streptomyces cyaneofuscatus]
MKLEGSKNSDGAFITSAKATVTATDDDSGVDKVEYSLDGGPYLAYTAPVIVDRVGQHTVAHRATDKAGNTSEAKRVSFTIAQGGGVLRRTARSSTNGTPSSSARSTRASRTGSPVTAARSTS